MSENEIEITRVLNAPKSKVWEAWTDPEMLTKWWGPKDFTSPSCKLDLRVGGKYLFCMRSPDGKDYYSTGVYKELIPFEKFTATDSFADAEGNVVPPSYYSMEDLPDDLLMTLELECLGEKTRLTLLHKGLEDGTTIQNLAKQCWNEMLDKLEALLKA